jgi:predicted dehydrogenase
MNAPTVSRRRFLTQLASGVVAAPFVTRGLMAAPAMSQLNHASFGASGMAWSDIRSMKNHPKFNLVAVADVDKRNFDRVKKLFPNVRCYQDWRELLEKEGDKIDSVNVSTPDHMHAPIGMTAMAMGKHIYGQKPLAQTIQETRAMTLLAKKTGVVTQMGIQISSSFTERFAVKMVQDGHIGKIKEVHSFCSKTWGDMKPRPDRHDPVPDGLDWDLWLGVAEKRPYIKGYYHPSKWRKRRDFGTGTLGDMGCHMFSGWHRALTLTAPLSVLSRGPNVLPHNWATNEIIDYIYPGTRYTEGETIKVTWYDGAFKLPKEVLDAVGGKIPRQGSIYIGTQGAILAGHCSTPRLFPKEKFKKFRYPKLQPRNHYSEYIDACLDGKVASANFDYAGPLTESVLLGTLATCFPNQQLDWDAASMKFKNSPEASALVKRSYRKGWEIKGL